MNASTDLVCDEDPKTFHLLVMQLLYDTDIPSVAMSLTSQKILKESWLCWVELYLTINFTR